jgi:hypothetical protein
MPFRASASASAVTNRQPTAGLDLAASVVEVVEVLVVEVGEIEPEPVAVVMMLSVEVGTPKGVVVTRSGSVDATAGSASMVVVAPRVVGSSTETGTVEAGTVDAGAVEAGAVVVGVSAVVGASGTVVGSIDVVAGTSVGAGTLVSEGVVDEGGATVARAEAATSVTTMANAPNK